MFRRARYQQGMLDRVKRKRGPDCWILRWRETDAKGKRVRRKSRLGTVEEYPTEASARRAAEALRFVLVRSSFHASAGREGWLRSSTGRRSGFGTLRFT